LVSAARTSSSLKGLMMAVTSFMGSTPCVYPCHPLGHSPPEFEPDDWLTSLEVIN
jgi:hypothetical protein